MKFQGRAWKYGDNVDTDQIIPAKFLVTIDPAELGRHLMEDADPELVKRVTPGDVMVGLKNFGCGSSREHAPIAIKAAGISAVIAKSFGRIFFRNCINLGLPLFETDAAERINAGDQLELNPETGEIRNLTKGETYQAAPMPPFAREIMDAGGLMPYVARKVGLAKAGAHTPSSYEQKAD